MSAAVAGSISVPAMLANVQKYTAHLMQANGYLK
jgi:hypothetical protein